MATSFSMTMFAGETRTIEVTLTDQDGLPIDLTNASITYRAELPTPIVKTSEVGGGITITSPTDGEFEIRLESADTSGIEESCSVPQECRAVLESGDVVVVFYGNLTVMRGIIGV